MSKQTISKNRVWVVVLERATIRVLPGLSEADALALLACASEDPATWNDLKLVWPRYKLEPENTACVTRLPMRQLDLPQALQLLDDAGAWLALDLVERRVLTGGHFPLLRLRHEPIDKDGPLTRTTLLAPWWELSQRVAVTDLLAGRRTPLKICDPRRDVLWGQALTDFCAQQMLAAIRGGVEWVAKDWEGKPCGNYAVTIGVHRDWLLTPRDDLAGGTPRDCLHLGMEWIDDLAACQAFRVYEGEELIPIPTDLSTYETAAMGRHEVILYFDACRETIDAGWRWLLQDQRRIDGPQAWQPLAARMHGYLVDWLASPHEGGPTPTEIIRCDRVRIPLVEHGDNHVMDCDCPICEMMASGQFGPSIAQFDGHTLEVDGEFAFSIHATREAWEAEQCEWADTYEDLAADVEVDEQRPTEPDEFDSVWPGGGLAEAGIPGDSLGHLGLAFLLADMIGRLKSGGADQADIDLLNAAFRQYRSAASPSQSMSLAERFKQVLEQLAGQHPALLSQAADVQSRIDELLRQRPVA